MPSILDIDKKLKAKIIAALRKITRSCPSRTEAKNNARVDPGAYQCAVCGLVMYEGVKPLEKTGYLEMYGRVVKTKVRMDHISPIIPIDREFDGFDSWILRGIMIPPSAWQCLCPECNDIKTSQENEERVKRRKDLKDQIAIGADLL